MLLDLLEYLFGGSKPKKINSANVRLTRYKIINLADYDRTASLDHFVVRDGDKTLLLAAPVQFIADLRMEGMARTESGVIGYDAATRGYTLYDPKKYPWGVGIGNRPLVPFKSCAVDPAVIPIGSRIFLSILQGVHLPDGTVHSGYIDAVDVGRAIRGYHIDLFSGGQQWYSQLDAILSKAGYADDTKLTLSAAWEAGAGHA